MDEQGKLAKMIANQIMSEEPAASYFKEKFGEFAHCSCMAHYLFVAALEGIYQSNYEVNRESV